MGQAAFFIPVVSCSTQRLRINMAIYFFWLQVPALVTTPAALPGLPRYLLPSILESYVQYPAFYKYGTSPRSCGWKAAWNAGVAGRESVQSPPLFQGENGANYISLSQTVNEAQGTINILWIDLGSSPP